VSKTLDISSDAQILSTKGTGTKWVNDPMLKLINEEIRTQGAISWNEFWKEVKKRFGAHPDFRNYVSPPKNLGVLFLRAYRQRMPSESKEKAASSGISLDTDHQNRGRLLAALASVVVVNKLVDSRMDRRSFLTLGRSNMADGLQNNQGARMAVFSWLQQRWKLVSVFIVSVLLSTVLTTAVWRRYSSTVVSKAKIGDGRLKQINQGLADFKSNLRLFADHNGGFSSSEENFTAWNKEIVSKITGFIDQYPEVLEPSLSAELGIDWHDIFDFLLQSSIYQDEAHLDYLGWLEKLGQRNVVLAAMTHEIRNYLQAVSDTENEITSYLNVLSSGVSPEMSDILQERIAYLLEKWVNANGVPGNLKDLEEKRNKLKPIVLKIINQSPGKWISVYAEIFDLSFGLGFSKILTNEKNPYASAQGFAGAWSRLNHTLDEYEKILKEKTYQPRFRRDDHPLSAWSYREDAMMGSLQIILWAMHHGGSMDSVKFEAAVERADHLISLLDEHGAEAKKRTWSSEMEHLMGLLPPERLMEIIKNETFSDRKRALAMKAFLAQGISENDTQLLPTVKKILFDDRTRPELKKAAEEILKRIALYYIRQLNELHESPDAVRFQSVENLSIEDLYFNMVYGEEEVFTSTFNGLFNRLLERMRNQGLDGQRMLEKIKYDHFRTFIKLAASYNRLNEFLSTTNQASSQELLKRFVSGIEKEPNTLEQAVSVADTFSILTDEGTLKVLQETIKSEYERTQKENSKEGTVLYGLLAGMFGQKAVINEEWIQSMVQQYGLPSVTELTEQQLFNAQGIHLQRYFFYDDEDGKTSFQNFLARYENDPNWKVERKDSFVRIQSVRGHKIEIYANVPAKQEEGRNAIKDVFVQKGNIEPIFEVHRGHSYHAGNTLYNLTKSAKLVYWGSCGGYNNVAHTLDIAPEAQILSTKGTGTKWVNDPLLKLINEEIRTKGHISWPSFWKEVEQKLGNHPDFINYISPPRNLGVLFLKAYRQRMPSSEKKQAGARMSHPVDRSRLTFIGQMTSALFSPYLKNLKPITFQAQDILGLDKLKDDIDFYFSNYFGPGGSDEAYKRRAAISRFVEEHPEVLLPEYHSRLGISWYEVSDILQITPDLWPKIHAKYPDSFLELLATEARSKRRDTDSVREQTTGTTPLELMAKTKYMQDILGENVQRSISQAEIFRAFLKRPGLTPEMVDVIYQRIAFHLASLTNINQPTVNIAAGGDVSWYQTLQEYA